MTVNKFGQHFKKIGNKYYPQKRSLIRSEKLWQEQTWEARQEDDGRCYFEFLVARQGSGTDTYEISSKEFNAIKSGELKFDDLIKLTDQNPDRKPIQNEK